VTVADALISSVKVSKITVMENFVRAHTHTHTGTIRWSHMYRHTCIKTAVMYHTA